MLSAITPTLSRNPIPACTSSAQPSPSCLVDRHPVESTDCRLLFPTHSSTPAAAGYRGDWEPQQPTPPGDLGTALSNTQLTEAKACTWLCAHVNGSINQQLTKMEPLVSLCHIPSGWLSVWETQTKNEHYG